MTLNLLQFFINKLYIKFVQIFFKESVINTRQKIRTPYVYISVRKCSGRFSASSWSIMVARREEMLAYAYIPYSRVLFGESGDASWMWASRDANLRENLRWQYHPFGWMRRGVKLFMIIPDSTVNKSIFHSVTHPPAKRSGRLPYTGTLKIRAPQDISKVEINCK